MVLWLPFDEDIGPNSANLAPGGNNGFQVNNPLVVNGYVLRSLRFDGVSQYVDVPNYPAINPGTNDLTIDAWVNRATNSDTVVRIIVDKRNGQTGVGYSLSVSFGHLIFQLADGIGTGFSNYQDVGIVPADDQWHFVAVSVTRNQVDGGRFYIDGNPTGIFDPTGRQGSLNNSNSLWVGRSPLNGNLPWMGNIDEVEMFNRALDTIELQNIFNAGPSGKCKPVPPAKVASVNSIMNNGVANSIGLCFDHEVTLPSATDPLNYTVYMKTSIVNVASVILQPNGRCVALNLVTPIGEFFSVSVSNVMDAANHLINESVIGYISDYTSTDVGTAADPNPAGQVYTAHGDTFDVTTGGSDIGGIADFFHFIHQEVIGDFDMTVLVTRLDPADPFSKAGLMARETNAPSSAGLQTYFTPVLGANQIQNTVRPIAGTDAIDFLSSSGLPVPSDPLRWLRLARSNNTFTAYYGSNGINWTVSGITTQAFSSTMNIGMAVASHTLDIPTTASFTDFGKIGARPGDEILPALKASLIDSNLVLTWLRTPRDFTVEISTNLTDWALMLTTIFEGTNALERSMVLPRSMSSNQLFLRLVRVDRVIPDPPLTLTTGLILSLDNANLTTVSSNTLCTSPSYTITNSIAQTNMNAAAGKTITFSTSDSGATLNTVLRVRKGNDLSPKCDDDSGGGYFSKQSFTNITVTNFTLVVAVKTNTPTTATLPIKVTITISP